MSNMPDSSDNLPTHRSQKITDDQHEKQGLTVGTWIALILGALILITLSVFVAQNDVPADFVLFGWTFSIPLGVATLLAAIAGMLIAGLFGAVKVIKLNHRVHKLEKEREELKRTLS